MRSVHTRHGWTLACLREIKCRILKFRAMPNKFYSSESPLQTYANGIQHSAMGNGEGAGDGVYREGFAVVRPWGAQPSQKAEDGSEHAHRQHSEDRLTTITTVHEGLAPSHARFLQQWPELGLLLEMHAAGRTFPCFNSLQCLMHYARKPPARAVLSAYGHDRTLGTAPIEEEGRQGLLSPKCTYPCKISTRVCGGTVAAEMWGGAREGSPGSCRGRAARRTRAGAPAGRAHTPGHCTCKSRIARVGLAMITTNSRTCALGRG